MNQDKEELFNSWLSEYQTDFLKIVNKYRLERHPLSVNEIISEINMGILKKKDSLIYGENSVMSSETHFKKVAYAFAKNFISWTADGITLKDKKYLNLRKDGVVSTEDDGDISFFEYVSQTLGSEDPFFEKFNTSEKFKNIIRWILEYSEFLSPRQKNLLELIISGQKLNYIAELTGVTHQAISFSTIEIFNSIKSHIKIDPTVDSDDGEKIKKGYKAVNYLFGESRVAGRSSKKSDLDKILKIVSNHPQKYTVHELVEKVGRRMNSKQICAYLCRTRNHKLLKFIDSRKHKKPQLNS